VLFTARRALVKRIGSELRADFLVLHKRMTKEAKDTAADGVTMGKRGLKNLCLSYLVMGEDAKALKLTYMQATTSKNMTDQIAGLGILAETTSPMRDKAFAAFEKKWRKVPTIMDKWFAVQASAKRADILQTVQKLMKHPSFTLKNPNRVSALVGVFGGNIMGFHAKDGSGYRFLSKLIMEIDAINPHVAAGLTKNFARWRDYDDKRQKLMLAELKKLGVHKKFSPNTAEIVAKSLKA
jgi:aminopeptidase N